MAEITAADARTLANANTTAIADELEMIYAGITASANLGFYTLDYVLTQASLKAAVISKLSGDLSYKVDVNDDLISLKIDWSGT